MKCLIIDAVHSAIAEELSKYMQVDTHMLPTQEELLKLIPDYDVLIMRVDPAINKEILDAAKNLKVIGVCSVGLNHIDLDTAKEKGIQVFNAPGLNGNAVAELTLCKMLEMSRHTPPATTSRSTKLGTSISSWAVSSGARLWAFWALAASASAWASWPASSRWTSSPMTPICPPMCLRSSMPRA